MEFTNWTSFLGLGFQCLAASLEDGMRNPSRRLSLHHPLSSRIPTNDFHSYLWNAKWLVPSRSLPDQVLDPNKCPREWS